MKIVLGCIFFIISVNIFSQNQPFNYQSIYYEDPFRYNVKKIELDPELIFFLNKENIKCFSFKNNISKNTYINTNIAELRIDDLQYLDKEDSTRDFPLNKYTRFDSILVKFHPKTYSLKEIQKYYVKNYDLVKWDTITVFSESIFRDFKQDDYTVAGVVHLKSTYKTLENNFTGQYAKYQFYQDSILYFEYLTLRGGVPEFGRGQGRPLMDKLGNKELFYHFVLDSLGWLKKSYTLYNERHDGVLENLYYNFNKNSLVIKKVEFAAFAQGDDFSLHTNSDKNIFLKSTVSNESLIDSSRISRHNKSFKIRLLNFNESSDLQLDFNLHKEDNLFYLNLNSAKEKLGCNEIYFNFLPIESNGKIFTLKIITQEFLDKYNLVFKDTIIDRIENKLIIEEKDLNIKNAPKLIWLSEYKEDKELIFNLSAKIFYNELGYPISFYYKDYRSNRWRKEEYTYDGTFLSSVKYYESRFGFTLNSTPEKALYKLKEVNDFTLLKRIQKISDTKFKILPSKYYKNGLVGEIEVEFWK
jgi:hypothetical protein